MQLHRDGVLQAWGGMVLLMGLLVAPPLRAQTPNPADPKQAAAMERAQREADRVYKWILIHADKDRAKKPAVAEAKAAAPAAPPPAQKAVARAKDEGITERVAPLNPPLAAPRTAAASAAEAPVQQAAAQPPAAQPSAVADTSPPPEETLALATPKVPAKPAPEPEEEDQPLVLVHQVDPEFPAAVLRRVQKGSVIVRFEVQPDGSVRQPEVVKTSNGRLNAAALEAVAQWRFKPLKRSQYGMVDLVFDMQ